MTAVRLGIVGYGAGGRWFHGPFVDVAEGIEVVGVVARSPKTIALVGEERPGVPTYPTLTDMLAATGAAAVDAVTITTPPSTHRDLILEAIAAGVPVVADKPFAPDPATARELRDAAADAGVVLAPFHNRRWDADLQTARTVLGDEVDPDRGVGPVRLFESTFDIVERHGIATGDGGGVLNDLGSHVVDQAVSLFGPVATVYAELDWWDARALGLDVDGRIDAGFTIDLVHVNGVRSHVSANKAVAQDLRRIRIVGEQGTYESDAVDIQAKRLHDGEFPRDDVDGWASEPAPGQLVRFDGEHVVDPVRSSYAAFYEQFVRAVRGEGAVPVSVDDAVHVADVLDAARRSDATRSVVRIG
jgi:predicted dehydrogenase